MRKKLLAVDDVPDNLLAVRAMVYDAFPELDVACAADGASALAMARSERPDVIALDIRLPDIDGFEVCRRLKADPETRDIPIAFVTALQDTSELKFQALEAGAEGFIPKPVDMPDFIVTIRSMLRIRDSNLERKTERERLSAMVDERTEELRRAQRAMLSLLEDLKAENEQRKETERELAARRAYLESILQTTQDGFFALSAGGAVIDSNAAFRAMLGHDDALFEKIPLRDIDASGDSVEVEGLLAEVARVGHRTVARDFLRRDGTVLPVELAISYRALPDAGYIVFCRDLTERKRSEEAFRLLQAELNHSQKMESIGRLAGGVAHDFNNMLGVIIGQTELSLDAVSPDDPHFHRLLEIRAAALRSSALTRQLLGFARKQTISPRPLCLNETVEAMLKMVRRLIGEDIELRWSPSEGLFPVMMDPGQVDQVLANLCVNARDAIAATGVIDIRTSNAVWTEEARFAWPPSVVPGDYATLEVADTGCGMDETVLARVFEPFFTTKEVGKGTGLGLATVYGIVKQNGGFVTVSSVLGAGTSFRIFFPRSSVERLAAPTAERHRDAPHGVGRVLLVEDEPVLLEMTSEMLESLGYQVVRAATPGEALSAFTEDPDAIDAMITDVILPEMSGPNLVVAIREDRPKLPVLYVSGYTAEEIDRTGLTSELDGFLQKPFSRKDLSEKIAVIIGSRTSRPKDRSRVT